ncbi:MAG: hypothetical protein J6K53_04250 [Roseburia sp.]|nr:hypothetical protein [Roseburia sp.]
MKTKGKHLPMYGVGPIYVSAIIGLTVLGIVLSIWNRVPIIRYKGFFIVMLILGIGLVVYGIYLWYAAVIKDKIDDGLWGFLLC